MNKVRQSRGFTLVEMLVSITILGIVTVISLPILSSISGTMTQRKINIIKSDVLDASKLYIDARSEDEFGNQTSGCVIVPFTTLENMKLVDVDLSEYNVDKNDVYVKVRRINDTYTYDLEFPITEEEKARAASGKASCDGSIDTAGPIIEISPTKTTGTIKSTEFNDGKKYVKVKIYDDYGLGKNISFTYTWYKSGSVFKTEKIDFNNEPMVPESGETSSVLDYKIQLPKTSTGEFDSGTFTLKIHPENVWDAVGNFNTTDVDSGTYEFDNIPPTMVIKLYQESGGNKTGNVLKETTNSNIKIDDWAKHGYYIEVVDSSDNFAITQQIWQWNASGNVTFNDDLNNSRISVDSVATDKTLTAPGARFGKFKLCDHAGNCRSHTVTVNISPIFYVDYNGNGNDGGSTPTTVCYYNHDCAMANNGFTKAHHAFVNWTMDGANYNPGDSIKNKTTVHNTRYSAKANWKLITYTVTYNANGGSGAPEAQTKIDGEDLTLSSTKPSKTGYDFMGWDTSSTKASTPTDYPSGGTYKNNSNVTLYAIWRKTISIKFDHNKARWLDNETKTCYAWNNNTSCDIKSPNISNISGSNDVGQSYSDLLEVKGWNTNSGSDSSSWSKDTTKTFTSGGDTYYAILNFVKTSKDFTVTPWNGLIQRTGACTTSSRKGTYLEGAVIRTGGMYYDWAYCGDVSGNSAEPLWIYTWWNCSSCCQYYDGLGCDGGWSSTRWMRW